jgi:DNA-binding transcriptional ArsR family regulator
LNEKSILNGKEAMPTQHAAKPASTVFEINELEHLRIISDPLRLRLIAALYEKPLTVKQVADELELKPTKLYYHVSELERIGVVKVMETRVKSGIIEKYYQTLADQIKVNRSLLRVAKQSLAPSAYGELLASLMEATADDLRLGVAQGVIKPPSRTSHKTAVISRSTLTFDPVKADRLLQKFAKLVTEINAADDKHGETHYGFTVAFYPMRSAESKQDSDEQ